MSALPERPFLQLASARSAEQPDIESSTEAYARRFVGPVGEWFLQLQAAHTLALLEPLGRPLRIVDVGGGHAQLVPHLLAAGHKVVAVGSTAACGQRLEPWLRNGRCRFEVAPLTELPFGDGSFDVALSFRILSHLGDWRPLITELCRVARRSVVLDYPARISANRFSEALFFLKLRIEGNTRGFRVFSTREIQGAFDACGYRVAASRRQYLFPMALHRLLRSVALARSLEAPARLLGLTRGLGSPVIVRADRS